MRKTFGALIITMALAVFAVCFSALGQSSLTLDEVVLKMEENFKKVNSYQADFRQEIMSVNQGREISAGSGKVMYKKPGMMSWKYIEPDEHLYITNGSTIYDYSPEDKEVYVMSVKDAMYKSFLLGLADVKKQFEVSFHAGRRLSQDGSYQLDLVPKDPDEREAIGLITLYLDPKSFLVKSTETVDALGNRNMIKFENVKLNPDLPDGLFKFEFPEGVKIIKGEKIEPGETVDVPDSGEEEGNEGGSGNQ